jgi:isopenicillin-N N-acyltransferase-like protein
MNQSCTRREFLHRVAATGSVAAGFPRSVGAADIEPKVPRVADHELTVISGKPRERGKQYGQRFKNPIRDFLDKEIVQLRAPTASRDELRRYAGQCIKAIQEYSPVIVEELEGMAEGSGLNLEELVLITLHEEVAGHKGSQLPAVTHCTALAAAPPDTIDRHAYVGQNWDWMNSAYGLSSLLLWKRPEGPSVLAYSFPGLWVGAGLNSAGLALCWTWGNDMGIKAPRVGIPSYVLIAQMLYQDTLAGALKEAERAGHAGWFAFVLGDADGNLATVDGTPEKLVIQRPRGHTARASYACREILGGAPDQPLQLHPQCQRMFDLLASGKGKLDRSKIKSFFADHQSTICKHPGFIQAGSPGFTIDSMLFDCTAREAHLSRGPGCSGRWKTFTFDGV